jgi:hypothetical protein
MGLKFLAGFVTLWAGKGSFDCAFCFRFAKANASLRMTDLLVAEISAEDRE